MMGYREAGEGAEGTSRQGELGEDGMRNSRWLSLRCLYTRGSCMAVGHISVSRERGAPPKNQIECKNRINSSWRVESYVGSVCVRSNPLPPSLSLARRNLLLLGPAVLSLSFAHAIFFSSVLLFAVRATRPRSHDSTSNRKADHLPYFLLFCLSAAHESYAVRRAYEGSALYRQAKPRSATFRPMSCSRGEEWGDPPRNNFARDTNCLPTDPCTC